MTTSEDSGQNRRRPRRGGRKRRPPPAAPRGDAPPGAAGRQGDAAADTGRIDPLAMTVAQAAKILSAMGVGQVTEEMIRRDAAAGAPTSPDGRINLVHYAAWLNQQTCPPEREPGPVHRDPSGAGDHAA